MAATMIRSRLRLPALLLTALLLAAIGGDARAQTPPAATATATPSSTMTALFRGWNNIAYVGEPAPVRTLAAAIGGDLRAVWIFNARTQRWHGYSPQAEAVSDIDQIEPETALWIAMAAPGTLTQRNPRPLGAPVVLHEGLNNFIYRGQQRPLDEALSAAGARLRTVWMWDPSFQIWRGADVLQPQASDFSVLTPERTYTVRLEPGAPVTLIPGTPPDLRGRRTCYPDFVARQPNYAEVRSALNRAAHARLITTDPSFAPHPLNTRGDGSGDASPAYVPPALLKALAWTESLWRQASFDTARGSSGPVLTSRSCAYGLLQVLSGMDIADRPTPRQQQIGTDYVANIAAGVRILTEKWNFGPEHTPIVMPRRPEAIESWYFAVWAYHCWGPSCRELGLHDNPDDPVLTWPRPVYNSPEQLSSGMRFSRADYPYQELVWGLLRYPARPEGTPLWNSITVPLPRPGEVGYPNPKGWTAPSQTYDPTGPNDP